MVTDEVELRDVPLRKVPFFHNNEPLLGMFDKIQQDRSHLAFVTRFSAEKASKFFLRRDNPLQPSRPRNLAKRGLAQLLCERVALSNLHWSRTFWEESEK